MRCKDCRFHCILPAPGNAKVCNSLGVIEEDKACALFKPNHRSVRFDKKSKTAQFRKLVAGMPVDQLKLIASFLNQEALTRKRGFHFGQEVFVLILGGDYLKNYRRAIVVSADSKQVYVTGRFEKFSGNLMHSSVLTQEAWEKKRVILLKENRITDPNHYELWHSRPSNKVVSSYQPPCIDDALSESDAKDAKAKKHSRLIPVDSILKTVVG